LKKQEYLEILKENESQKSDHEENFEDLPNLYDKIQALMDEYEENSEILKIMQQLPPDLDLARQELAKLKEEVAGMGRRKRELLKI
jgi:hypothetical protein